MDAINDISLKNNRRVWNGNKNEQLRKISCNVAEMAPPIRLYGSWMFFRMYESSLWWWNRF